MELVRDRQTRQPFAKSDNLDLKIREKLRKRGLLLGATRGVIVFGPPLIITQSDVDEIVNAIDLTLWELEDELGIARSPQ